MGTGPLGGGSWAEASRTRPRCTTSPVSRVRPVQNAAAPVSSGVRSQSLAHKTIPLTAESAHFPRDHPDVIKSNIAEVEEFARSLHDKVLDPLFDLVSIALELPQDFFRNLHKYETKSEDHLRYMKYSAYDQEKLDRLLAADGLYSQGHTDLGTLTLLFRQPVAALQIKDHSTGQWKWAKPLNGSLTVNVSVGSRCRIVLMAEL